MMLRDYINIFKEELPEVIKNKISDLSVEKTFLENKLNTYRTNARNILYKVKIKDLDVLYAFSSLYVCREEKRLAEVIVELENIFMVKDELFKIEQGIESLDIDGAKSVPIEDLHGGMSRKGKIYVGNCPFHKESHPSFTVYPNTNSYYCFSCHKGGDSINFVMETEGLTFLEAVRRLS